MQSSADISEISLAGVIFDFDGTLFESMYVWDTVFHDYLKKHNIPAKEDLNKKAFTMSLSEAVSWFKEEYMIEDSIEKINEDLYSYITYQYEHVVMPRAGVLELLESMKQQGIKMAVASASRKHELMLAINRLGIADYFEVVLSVEDVKRGKKYPDIFDIARTHLGTRLVDTWVFEDSYFAMKTAKTRGYKVLAVKDSLSADREQEIREVADVYIDSFEHLKTRYMKAHDEVSPYVNVKSVVSIAGSDSSGGAGIQADLKTFMAHAVFGQSVITSVTAQNTLGVQGVADVPPHFIATQIDSVFQDIHPDAVKIGMLSNPEIIKVVAQKLLEHKAKHIVLDPVLVATSGSALIQKEAIELLISELLPLAEVITPNIYEAEILSGFVIKSKDDMLKAAKQIRRTTDAVIMIKGGHLEGRADDLVLDGERIYWLEAPRVDNENTHGTGCSLSSAIASNLARGDEVLEAIKGAKNYVYGAIEAGLDIGTKRGPLDHLYQYR